MSSLWSDTAKPPSFSPLQRELHTDVLIIGGGIAGILCAYLLKQAGIDNTLVEAKRICSGVTHDTTAKLTAQHGLIYSKLIRRFGEDKARLYLEANQNALQQYRILCSKIDCDYQELDAFVYALENRDQIEAEWAALERLGAPVSLATDLPLPFPVAGAVRFPNQGQFHPLKFLSAITADLNIFEGTKVQELQPHKALTNHGSITANRIIVTTHFPLLNKHGSYFLKLYQSRSYVLALENAPDVKGMYVDASKKGLSFRNYHQLLLLGGSGHRTGKQSGNWDTLTAFAQKHYPQAREVGRWATQDCMTLDDVPYIGQYSRRTPDLYVATGFNKWGMTSSMVAAMLLTELLSGNEPPAAALFSPSRTMLRPQLVVNGLEAVKNLLTPTVPRCPHMGCALKWNEDEHSWDCPCHGSRFSSSGELLNNPSTDDKPSISREKR